MNGEDTRRVREIVDKVLSREATMDVSTILAYSPADLAALR